MFHQHACESGTTHQKRFDGLWLFLVYLQAHLDGSSLNYYVVLLLMAKVKQKSMGLKLCEDIYKLAL